MPANLIVIDPEFLMWNVNEVEKDKTKFYELAEKLSEFIDVLFEEKPKLLLRNEILEEMQAAFPIQQLHTAFRGEFWDLTNRVCNFLAQIGDERIVDFDPDYLEGIYSVFDLVKPHYSATAQEEVSYLISEMHVTQQEKYLISFVTFEEFWEDANENLKTVHEDKEVLYETVVYTSGEVLDKFFASRKRIFVANPKHDKVRGHKSNKGDFVSKLEIDDQRAQELLESAVGEGEQTRRLYNYAEEINKVIVFDCHLNNEYHAHPREVNDVGIPNEVRKKLGLN